ncbi:hypothetical protein SAMN05660297_02284 [Natronincola peptidivorans]|uniref:Lipoprotein n=1 Tax=Natronincola peptidivorans TaxID=426128 RepID=A0A1I0E562_9FIRM|nr:hypothetical protein [Natronincola peptidivorans]SET40266.1 hypothetical protein SAMN05660297_02284 [Natronincola peptidivorans]
MKKLLSLFIVISLLFTIITGCSSPQKTEEELRAEIKAELEAEEKLRKELEAEIRAELEAEKQQKEEQKEESTPVGQTTIEEVTPIALSVFMTKDQIIEKLGHNYTFETKEDGAYVDYRSILEYDGIEFYFGHNTKKLPADQYPSGITITSNKYRFSYDFNIGDPALKAIAYCEKNFENAEDFHGGGYIFDSFQYKEDNSPKGTTAGGFGGLRMRFFYNTSRSYSSKDDMSEDVKIEEINIFAPMD